MFIIYSFDSCNQKLVESETPEIEVIMVRLVPFMVCVASYLLDEGINNKQQYLPKSV